MPELRARTLSKHFSGITAVRHVDFTLRPGEIVGYLGPNGSGKTTTVRMLAGLLEPSSGRVEYGGRRVDEDPSHIGVSSVTSPRSRFSIRFSRGASISS